MDKLNCIEQYICYNYIDYYYGFSDNNYSYPDKCLYTFLEIFLLVFYIIVFCLGLPVNYWAFYRLYRLFQSGSRVSVYIINLLLADLLQLATLPTLSYALLNDVFYGYAMTRNLILLFVSQSAIAWFLVLVSLERYLSIARPALYHRIQRLRCALPIALGVWGLCSFNMMFHIFYISYIPHFNIVYTLANAMILYLLSLILLVYSFFGTWRALARTSSVPDAERMGAVWTVALALITFIVVYSPHFLTLLMGTTSLLAGINFDLVNPLLVVTPSLLSLTVVLSPLLCLFLRESPRDTGEEEPEYEDISSKHTQSLGQGSTTVRENANP